MVGAPDQNYLSRQFNAGSTTGTFSFSLPYIPGHYEFRYFLGNSLTKVAISNALTVSGVVGDVNGDGVVNCQDLTAAASSVGKRSGQPGFLPTADIDLNGVIDIRDIAAISRLLAAGTRC